MSNPIELLVQQAGDPELSITRLRILNLEKWLYRTYEPNKFGEEEFEDRLIRWLDNVPSESDKRTLLRLLTQLFYIGPVEFEELYRCAYEGPIARWLIDCEKIDVCAAGAENALATAASETWFCPITDSFRINAFFHINNLAAGGSLRPDWRSLCKFADAQKLIDFCVKNRIKRLVLLEDFVGGGSQSLKAVEFATKSLTALQVLFVPLIICPDGVKNARSLIVEMNALRPRALQYQAVLELPPSAFLTRTQSPFQAGDPYIDTIRELIERTYPKVSGGVVNGKPYDPFGYPPPPQSPTGGLVVMFSNTPDNTLPLVQWRPKSNTWSPIFPRHSRD